MGVGSCGWERAPLGARLGNEGRIQQLVVGGGGGDPDREAVGVAGMGCVGTLCRQGGLQGG